MAPLKCVRASATALVLAFLLSAALGCGTIGAGGGGGDSPFGATGTRVLLNLGDAAPDQVVALQIAVNSVTMNQGGGAQLSALSGPVTAEFSHRTGSFAPVGYTTSTLPVGTYDAITITLANANVTFVDTTGTVQQRTATLSPASVTVALSPSLTISDVTPLVVNLDFLPSSIAIDGSNNVTITPAFRVSTALAASPTSAQVPETGKIVDLTGKVEATVAAGAPFSLLMPQIAGGKLTFSVDAATVYSDGLTTIAQFAPQIDTILEVEAVTQGNGTLIATRVEQEMTTTATGGSIQGIIRAVTLNATPPNPVDSFTMFVHNFATTGALPSLGNTIPVDITAVPFDPLNPNTDQFIIDGQGTDLTGLPFAPTFDPSSIRAMQEVEAIFPNITVNPTAAGRLKLKRQGFAGQVGVITGGSGGQQIFQFSFPSDSAFAQITGVTTITGIKQASTEAVGGATVSPGNPLVVRGLLFFDTVSSGYFLVADRIENP